MVDFELDSVFVVKGFGCFVGGDFGYVEVKRVGVVDGGVDLEGDGGVGGDGEGVGGIDVGVMFVVGYEGGVDIGDWVVGVVVLSDVDGVLLGLGNVVVFGIREGIVGLSVSSGEDCEGGGSFYFDGGE